MKLSVPASVKTPSLKIKAGANAPYGVDSFAFFINGDKIYSGSSSGTEYLIPDEKNNSTIKVKVELKDKNGNIAEDSQDVSVEIPAAP